MKFTTVGLLFSLVVAEGVFCYNLAGQWEWAFFQGTLDLIQLTQCSWFISDKNHTKQYKICLNTIQDVIHWIQYAQTCQWFKKSHKTSAAHGYFTTNFYFTVAEFLLEHFSAAHLSYLQPTYLSVQRSNICVQPSAWSVAAYQTQQRVKAAERSATCLYIGERKRSKAEWEYILRCGVPQHLMGDDSCGWTQAEGRKTEVSSPEGRGCPNTPTGISAAPWWEIPRRLLNVCVHVLCWLYSLFSHDNISFSNLLDCWCLNVLNWCKNNKATSPEVKTKAACTILKIRSLYLTLIYFLLMSWQKCPPFRLYKWYGINT